VGRSPHSWTQSTSLSLTSGCLKLKRKLQRELDDARIARLRHLPEAAEKSKGGIRISRDQELSVIERVEELRAELQVGPLRELEVLEDRQINVVNSRPPDRVTSGIAEAEEWYAATLANIEAVVSRRVEIIVARLIGSSTAASVECAQGARIEGVRLSHQIRSVQATGLLTLIVV